MGTSVAMEMPISVPAEEKEKVGLAIFGLGRIGRVHLKNLVDDARSDIFWLVDEEKVAPGIEDLVKKYRLVKTTIISPQFSHHVFSDHRVQAVMIFTQTPQHEHLIRAALEAGKHVMVEKPIVYSAGTARELYDLAKSCGVILFSAMNRRHDPQLKEVKRALRHGDVGPLRMIKACSRDAHSVNTAAYIQSSGGTYLDTLVHSFDLVYWLASEKPHSVVAFAHAHNSVYAENDDVDNAVVMLKFKSGLIAILDHSREGAYGFDLRVEVLGTMGMIVSNNPKQSEMEVFTSTGTTQQPTYFDFIERYKESYKQEVKHFVDAVLGKVDIEDSTGEGAVLAVRLAQLSAESSKTGKVLLV